MKITHFGHSCVLVETHKARLLIDPGTFSEGYTELTGLDAIVITHQHDDHLDVDRLPPVFDANPGVRFIVDPGSAAHAARELDGMKHVIVAHPGDVIDVAGTRLDVVGGDHAPVHPELATIPNVGYVVDDGAFFHPGDSLVVPVHDIDVLALPTAAPWLKLEEVIDYFRAVHSRVAVPIHEAVLAYPEMHYGRMGQLAPHGATLRVLHRGVPTSC